MRIRQPTRRKIDSKKSVWRSAAEDRRELVEHIGIEEFLTNPAYETLQDIDPPVCFTLIYGTFIELYCSSQDGLITYTDIASYEFVMGERLTSYEVMMIKRCNAWAGDEAQKMREEDDSKQ